MKNYLVIIESGKNNIGISALHILRKSFIVKAESASDAFSEAQIQLKHNSPTHFGHSADYATIIDIKQINGNNKL